MAVDQMKKWPQNEKSKMKENISENKNDRRLVV